MTPTKTNQPDLSDMTLERLENLLSSLRNIKNANPSAPGLSQRIDEVEAEIASRVARKV